MNNKKKSKKNQKIKNNKKKKKKKSEIYNAVNVYTNYFVFATIVFFKLIAVFFKSNIINFNAFKNILFVASAFAINFIFFNFVKA